MNDPPNGPPRVDLLSFVIPVLNEQETLPRLREELDRVAARLPCAVEFVLVDDGSRDRSRELLLSWAGRDPRLTVIGLSRNFGHQPAITAGLDHAKGNAVLVMDADLQDPPALATEMLEALQAGHDIVFARRQERQGESWFKKSSAWLFYRFFRNFVQRDLQPDTGDFYLLSRAVVDVLCGMRERHRFLRGMSAWVGFKQTSIPYVRRSREAGTTKFPLRKMLRFALDAMLSFSTLPLQLVSWLGILVLLAGIAGLLFTSLSGAAQPLLGVGLAVVVTLNGLTLLSVGVLGQYVGRILDEVRGRPLYAVDVLAHFDLAGVEEFEQTPVPGLQPKRRRSPGRDLGDEIGGA